MGKRQRTIKPLLPFTCGPDDWKALIADPRKPWRKGYSARTLAHCWETADGFPPEVAAVLYGANDPLLVELTPVLAIPEFKVPLPGGGRASQNDIFVLARSACGPVVIMVEGKVDESFGLMIGEWLQGASERKRERLRFLRRSLGLRGKLPDRVRYQLLHRAVSGLVTRDQYRACACGAADALLLAHSDRVVRLCGVHATVPNRGVLWEYPSPHRFDDAAPIRCRISQ